MRLQFSSLVMYERRRSIAISNTRDADFDLIDDDGNVELSFRQTITWELDTSAYDAACNPPIDDSMERMERHSARQSEQANARRGRKRRKPAYDRARFTHVPPKGEAIDVSYKTGDRQRGNVALSLPWGNESPDR